MTDLEEISASAEANYAFWTALARFYLSQYRGFRGLNVQEAAWQRANFRKQIKYRREQRFYGD